MRKHFSGYIKGFPGLLDTEIFSNSININIMKNELVKFKIMHKILKLKLNILFIVILKIDR